MTLTLADTDKPISGGLFETPARGRICGIYRIYNKRDRRVYIGQSVSIYTRWKQHIEELNDKTHSNYLLQRDWTRLDPDDFEFSVIEECLKFQLDEREDYWIERLNTHYNLRWSDNSKIARVNGRIVPRESENDLMWLACTLLIIGLLMMLSGS